MAKIFKLVNTCLSDGRKAVPSDFAVGDGYFVAVQIGSKTLQLYLLEHPWQRRTAGGDYDLTPGFVARALLITAAKVVFFPLYFKIEQEVTKLRVERELQVCFELRP